MLATIAKEHDDTGGVLGIIRVKTKFFVEIFVNAVLKQSATGTVVGFVVFVPVTGGRGKRRRETGKIRKQIVTFQNRNHGESLSMRNIEDGVEPVSFGMFGENATEVGEGAHSVFIVGKDFDALRTGDETFVVLGSVNGVSWTITEGRSWDRAVGTVLPIDCRLSSGPCDVFDHSTNFGRDSGRGKDCYCASYWCRRGRRRRRGCTHGGSGTRISL